MYFLKYRLYALEAIKEFRAMVERQSGKKIKVLRTDSVGENIFNNLYKYHKAHGICRQITISYTSQQNAAVERKNRTFVEMERSMPKGKCL